MSGSRHRAGLSRKMEKYLFATRKLISNPKTLQRKLTLSVSGL